jgi:hypothetical protein
MLDNKYVREILQEAKQKIMSFFQPLTPTNEDIYIRNFSDNHIYVTINKKLFNADDRILGDLKTYNFDIECFCDDKNKTAQLILSTMVKIKRNKIPPLSYTNFKTANKFCRSFVIFGDFAKHLGLSNKPQNKKVGLLPLLWGKKFYILLSIIWANKVE